MSASENIYSERSSAVLVRNDIYELDVVANVENVDYESINYL